MITRIDCLDPLVPSEVIKEIEERLDGGIEYLGTELRIYCGLLHSLLK